MDNASTKNVLVIAPPKACDFICSHLDGPEFFVTGQQEENVASPMKYDCIIVCEKSAGCDNREVALRLTESGKRMVLYIVSERSYESAREVLDGSGVLIMSLPCTKKTLTETAAMICQMNGRLSGEIARQSRLEEKIGEERLVSRAKLTLITTLGMSEAQAHRFIEKQAMDMRLSKRSVAENILKTYEN